MPDVYKFSLEDKGCRYHPSCLTCPFTTCLMEDKKARDRHDRKQTIAASRVLRDEKIVAFAQKGGSVRDTARRFDLTEKQIGRILRLADTLPWQMLAKRNAEILRRYRAGEPPRDIALSMGLARTSVYRLLQKGKRIA